MIKYWLIAVLSAACLVLLIAHAPARDLDGKYVASPLHDWFNGLKSGKGLCCSFADGRTVTDAEWEMAGDHYRVNVDGKWLDVPPEALVDVPNKFGQAVVWPYVDMDGVTKIRCFLPGAGT